MKIAAFVLTLLVSGSAFAVCNNNAICAKDYVIDNTSNSTGQVAEVFTNGRANVKYDRWGYRTASVSDLSKAARCDHGICRKDRVIMGKYVGTVMIVYSNTKAFVKWDKYGWQLSRTTKLSKAFKN